MATRASWSDGFSMVMYSWNPGRVEPSARSHSTPGLSDPAEAVVPVTEPVESNDAVTIMKRDALKKAEDEATTEISRLGPTPVSSEGTTKASVRGSTST